MPKNIIINDLSINSLLLNLNNGKKNPPLLLWGGKNKKDIDDKKNSDIVEKNLQKSINNSNFIFSMRLDKLLKDMEKERETNYKNISYNNIVNYLDKASHSAPQGGTLNALLENINKTFSYIKLGNLSTPPPIRDPSWRIRSRRRSMYSTAPLPLALPQTPPPPTPHHQKNKYSSRNKFFR